MLTKRQTHRYDVRRFGTTISKSKVERKETRKGIVLETKKDLKQPSEKVNYYFSPMTFRNTLPETDPNLPLNEVTLYVNPIERTENIDFLFTENRTSTGIKDSVWGVGRPVWNFNGVVGGFLHPEYGLVWTMEKLKKSPAWNLFIDFLDFYRFNGKFNYPSNKNPIASKILFNKTSPILFIVPIEIEYAEFKVFGNFNDFRYSFNSESPFTVSISFSFNIERKEKIL